MTEDDTSKAPGPAHLIITIHGIRTFGAWQSRLERLVRVADPKCEVRHFRFNYFSAVAFWFPPTRGVVVRRFARRLENVAKQEDPARVDIVAHSFGTHVAARGIRKAKKVPRIHTVILAGSVLKSSYFWEDIIPSRIERLVNECGHRDNVLLLSQSLVPLTGMAGRMGFGGLLGKNFTNRYYNFGHSGYFNNKEGKADDEFMRSRWLPLLIGDNDIEAHDERGEATPLGGVWITILQWLDPVKMTVIWSLIIGILLFFVGLWVDAAATRERLRTITNYSLTPAAQEQVVPLEDVQALKRAIDVDIRTRHVILVDDSPNSRMSTIRNFSRWGICFTLSKNTSEAIAELEARPGFFSLVISDWARSGGDSGRETALALSHLPRANRPPLLIFSPFSPDNEEISREARALGAIDGTNSELRLLARSLAILVPENELDPTSQGLVFHEWIPSFMNAGIAWLYRIFYRCA